MRKFLLIVFLFLSLHTSFTASASLSVLPHDPTPSEVIIPLTGTNKFVTLEQYMSLTPQAYREITGSKMRLSQRVDLAIGRQFIKKAIRKDGTVDVSKMKKRGFFGGWQWHWGGFALGLFFSFLGPIIALFFNDDYKWDRFWTALHTALYVGLILLIVAAALSGLGA